MPTWVHGPIWGSDLEKFDGTPRPHHYYFARSALPGVFFSQPARTLSLLVSSSSESFVNDLWHSVGVKVASGGLGEALPPSGLKVEKVVAAGCRAVNVRLPDALKQGECLFVLLVEPRPRLFAPKRDGIWDLMEKRGAPRGRCFALEMSRMEPAGPSRLTLSEFSTLMGYVQTGYQCAPEPRRFVDEVMASFDVY